MEGGVGLKVVSVVGPKKSGKTSLVEGMVRALRGRGRIGTIKNMPDHPVEDRGDTRRHFEAGADVVVGVGQGGLLFKVSSEGGLKAALEELRASGVEYAIVEGFKTSGLPKIVLGGIEVDNLLRRVDASPPFDEGLIEELIGLLVLQPEI